MAKRKDNCTHVISVAPNLRFLAICGTATLSAESINGVRKEVREVTNKTVYFIRVLYIFCVNA